MMDQRPRVSAISVTALFEAQALSFLLPAGATFADLAELLEKACVRSNDRAIAVSAVLGTAASPSQAYHSAA